MTDRLIHCVMAWERRLEIERERGHRPTAYVNYLAAPQPCQGGRRSLLERLFGPPQASRTSEPERVDYARSGYNGWMERTNLRTDPRG